MASRREIPALEAGALVCLCAAAALRVFLVSAAFPFFNNVDEPAHFDLVLKYSNGRIPRGIEPYGFETGRLVAHYASPEFMEADPRSRAIAPLWTMPAELRAKVEQARINWGRNINYDAAQPPLYYAVAGAWYRLARAGGGDEGRAMYSVRFLNIVFIVALIGAAYFFLRRTYPDRIFLRLGVPALLAVLPQDFFYSISNDAPMPLLFAAAFYSLLEVLRQERPTPAFCAGAGSLCALTVLCKVSGLPILGLLLATAFLLARRRGSGFELPAILVAGALAPILVWVLRNEIVMGDPTGAAQKARYLTWTLKPLGELFRHPIFTARGAWFFTDELLKSYWRGEFFWHGARLWERAPITERFFTFSSLVFPAVSVLGLARGKNSAARSADAMGLLAIGLSVMFLVALSVAFDFGDCPYPSRALPYMFSGRLIAGTYVPFFALYLAGLERSLARWRRPWLSWAALGLIMAWLCCAQAALVLPAFASDYNWFHLPMNQ